MKPAIQTISSIALIAGTAQGIALPPWLSSEQSQSSSSNTPVEWRDSSFDSSLRKTVNFGPASGDASLHSVIDPTPDLVRFNNKASLLGASSSSSSCSRDADPSLCVGQATADDFLRELYPQSSFKLSSSHISKHSNVFHAYYIEVADGLEIANAFINVNVDLKTTRILSFGDSSYSKAHGPAKQSDWKTRVASWASSQFVFGSSQAPAASPRVKGHNTDPRHGLLALLSLVTDEPPVSTMISSDPNEVLQSMSVASLTDDSFLIAGVPTAVKDVPATLAYLNIDGTLRPTWRYELRLNDNAYEAYVSADAEAVGSEEPLSVIDWVRDYRPTGGEVFHTGNQLVSLAQPSWARSAMRSLRTAPSSADAKARAEFISATEEEIAQLAKQDRSAASPSYKVFPWGTNDPDEGKRQLLKGTLIEMSSDASPAGWHTIPSEHKGGKDTFYPTTRGNNVIAQDNPDGMNSFENNYRPSGGPNMTFAFPLHWPKAGHALEPTSYINASVTELFYTNNELHDFFWAYGFDEASGNFQESNFGRGGSGGDAVQANAQDGSGFNNANFMTPPDGQRPRMRMYVWNQQQPYRDGDFEAGIVTHEFAHGVSTRLTGGRMNSGCLGWGEAGGAGEGWGDFFATMIRMHDLNHTEYSMGEWASGRIGGIRNFRYSRNMTMNPDTYKSLDKPGYWGVHAIGEVWAEMLFEVAELLIEDHGFQSGSLFPPASSAVDNSDFYDESYKGAKVPKHGNTLAIQLVIDAMKIQPCRPSFVNMRDAIIQADHALTGGDNECTIWKGFAKRGLGKEAALVGGTPWGGGRHTEDYDMPAKCQKKKDGQKHAIA